MPIIDVSLLTGRSVETKRALIRELTDAAERALGVRRDGIRVILREVPAEHWGVAGQPIDDPRSETGDDSGREEPEASS